MSNGALLCLALVLGGGGLRHSHGCPFSTAGCTRETQSYSQGSWGGYSRLRAGPGLPVALRWSGSIC